MTKNATIGIVVLLVLLGGAYMLRNPYQDGSDYTTPAPLATTTPEKPVVTTPKTTTVKKTTTQTTTAVPTPKPVAPAITTQAPAGILTISYTNSGFSPATLRVTPGTSVRFVNNSSRGMRIVTENPESRFFKELNQSKTVGKGGTFDFTFLYVGTWNYNNQNNPTDRGLVIVE